MIAIQLTMDTTLTDKQVLSFVGKAIANSFDNVKLRVIGDDTTYRVRDDVLVANIGFEFDYPVNHVNNSAQNAQEATGGS